MELGENGIRIFFTVADVCENDSGNFFNNKKLDNFLKLLLLLLLFSLKIIIFDPVVI
jgi:hypothetical protein